MYFISVMLDAARVVIDSALTIYMWLIIISALLSWVNPDPYNPIVRTLRALTEPVLWRARRMMPFLYINGIDLSPMAVILAVLFARIVLTRSLAYLSILAVN